MSGSIHRRDLILVAVAIATVIWGALAFGAVYPWAYTILAVACAGVGVAALTIERRAGPPVRALAIALATIGAAIALQLVPLPRPILAAISPGTTEFLSHYDVAYELGDQIDAVGGVEDANVLVGTNLRPISIAPRQTITGGLLFAAFALFLLGMTRVASAVDARTLTRPLIVFGALLAIVGIAQRGMTAGEFQPLIYGFWKPQFQSQPFGPFVNPNHFAGWMLLVLPIAMATFFDQLQAAIAELPPRGARISLVNSPAFGRLAALGGMCLLMALSLLMTRSRSAMVAFAAGSLAGTWVLVRRQISRTARMVTMAAVVLLLGGAAVWAGADTVVGKFVDTQSGKSFSSRLSAWHDAVSIARDFPLTGSGLDTYGTAMILYQSGYRDVVHFQEAHNDYLQLAAEGGLLLGIPVIATLAIVAGQVRRRFREAPGTGTTYCIRVGAVVGLLSVAAQSLVEFSLQMPANAALLALVAGVALHRSPRLRVVRKALTAPEPMLAGVGIVIRD